MVLGFGTELCRGTNVGPGALGQPILIWTQLYG